MRIGIASLLVLAAWLTPYGAAGTIYVNAVTGNDSWNGLCATWDGELCGPKRTIQAAIDLAVPGDEVVLAPVTYTGDGNRDIDFLGKAITVRGEDPNDPNVVGATRIDCQANETDRHRGFNFVMDEQSDSVLAGITMIHGCAPAECGGTFAVGSAVQCLDSSPTIRACIFEQNHASFSVLESWGGCSQLNSQGAPHVSDCLFQANDAASIAAPWGSVVDFRGGSPVIERCALISNSGGTGGMLVFAESTALMTDCVLRDNAMPGYTFFAGAGVVVDGGNVTLTGCTLAHNAVEAPFAYGSKGGGMFVFGAAQVTLLQCDIRDNALNSAGETLGAGIYAADAQLALIDCSLTGNSAAGDEGAGGAICAVGIGSVTLVNTVVSGNRAASGGAFADTRATNPSTWCNLTITNCTLTGNRATTGSILDWPFGPVHVRNSVIWNGINWLGSVFNGDMQYSDVAGGWPGVDNMDALPLFVDPGHWNVNGTPTDPEDDHWINGDYRLTAASPCIDAGNNADVPIEVVLDLAGNPRFLDDPNTPDTGFGTPPIVDMGAYEYTSDWSPRTVFVDGTLGNDDWSGLCATWDGGMCGPKNTIQAGIDLAVPGDEVILAPVTYTGTGNRDIDFLGKGISVRGEDPNNPNVVAATVIDCAANWFDPHRAVNFVNHEGRDSILAGITIINGIGPVGCTLPMGGAVMCAASSPTIRACVFRNNEAYMGPAIESFGGCSDPNHGGSPYVSHCIFRDNINSSDWATGNTLDFWGGNPIIEACEFIGNRGGPGGCASFTWCDVVVTDCVFRNNTANGFGGGIFVDGSLRLTNTWLTGNSALGYDSAGGAICVAGTGTVEVTNCVIAGNQAAYGGGMACVYFPLGQTWCDLTVSNCTFVGNRATTGAAYAWQFGNTSMFITVIWNGPDWLGSDIFGGIQYCDIEGGWPDVGNIDADPRFVDAGHWDEAGTPSDPNDDVWVDGDYRLLAGSSCIDAGNNDAVPADVTTDLAGNPRRADDPATADTGWGTPPIVDMGAFEYTPLGDVNCDGAINFDDINAFVLALSDPDAYAVAFASCDRRKADCNGDGLVNFDDINAFVAVLSGE